MNKKVTNIDGVVLEKPQSINENNEDSSEINNNK